MISRRTILAAPLGLAACVTAPDDRAHALLRRAIAAAGGEAALGNARALAWTGRASIFAGQQTIEIGVDTVVEPFSYARSETWLVSQGRASTRILEIDGDQGWLTRNGERTQMPAPMLTHERQQYALYGLLRLVTLLEPGVALRKVSGLELEVSHPRALRTVLTFDDGARVSGAANTVAAPDGVGSVDQRMVFSGEIEGLGVRWFRRLQIAQRTGNADFAPFFDLRLDSFTPRQRR